MKLHATILIVFCLLLLPSYAQAKKDDKVAKPIPLEKAELTQLDALKARRTKLNESLQKAIQQIQGSDDDKDILSGAQKLKTAWALGEKLDQDSLIWLLTVREAHKCPDCFLNEDNVSLISRPDLVPPKPAEKPAEKPAK